jgi:1,4-alpha-glucan branching enzyme
LISDFDAYLFNEGTHYRLYEKLGAHPQGPPDDSRPTDFALWAPNARRVSVIGDLNDWTPDRDPLVPRGSSGIFSGEIDGVHRGDRYKYRIESHVPVPPFDKADPFGFRFEVAPGTASVVTDLDFSWQDRSWIADRGRRSGVTAPISIYEVHLGSFRRVPEKDHRSLTYREIAPRLIDHVRAMGFTHVEFLPVMEHPFYGSWGYEPTGQFAPTSRYGAPQDLMALIDALHRAEIGVILDWVPSHFPMDAFALGRFDGTHLYEHGDPRRGVHPDWGTYLYNYSRHEVRSFLISSALFWLDRYHADGLRVDGVASMLYLDYSRRPGEWVPNEHGGREDLSAISFLRQLNDTIARAVPDAVTVAEESTAWPGVTHPTSEGGLGFTYKWDMGWMHDTLSYFSEDPIHRSYHHDRLTFRALYAGAERFVLPLSHDEVVYGKGSLVSRMPNDPWQKFANLRLLYAYQYVVPGKKLLFMGGEFAQWREWAHDESLDWHLVEQPLHRGVRDWVVALNAIYRARPSLSAGDFDPEGFEWIDCNDRNQSVLAILRQSPDAADRLVAVLHFTPVVRPEYRVGVPTGGRYRVLANSDDSQYGGSGAGTHGPTIEAEPIPWHSRPYSVRLELPPLAALYLAPEV